MEGMLPLENPAWGVVHTYKIIVNIVECSPHPVKMPICLNVVPQQMRNKLFVCFMDVSHAQSTIHFTRLQYVVTHRLFQNSNNQMF